MIGTNEIIGTLEIGMIKEIGTIKEIGMINQPAINRELPMIPETCSVIGRSLSITKRLKVIQLKRETFTHLQSKTHQMRVIHQVEVTIVTLILNS